MWTCLKCGERLEDSFESCWKCSTLRPDIAARRAAEPPEPPKWRLAFEIFRSGWISWEKLLKQAADFANELGPERVVSISHSDKQSEGVVVVWYWTVETPPKDEV